MLFLFQVKNQIEEFFTEMQLGLIDYGMGNLHSVQQAFRKLGQPLKLITSPNDIEGCNALILPGVGAFDPAMKNLEKTELIPHIKNWVKNGKPLLGICLGLQLLFESSDEGSIAGLGLLKGQIRRLPSTQNERIPHMGWARLKWQKNCPLLSKQTEESWMYFVHSFAAVPTDPKVLSASVDFGKTDVTAVIWDGNLGACQFHPEKSSKAGNQMLENWLTWIKNEVQ